MPPVKSYRDTTLRIIRLQIKDDRTEALCEILFGDSLYGGWRVTVGLVTEITRRHERAEAASDMAMGRRIRINWRTIARRRVAMAIDHNSGLGCVVDPNDPMAIY